MNDYCEIPTFYNVRWPKARKAHRCVECGQPIPVGEKYCQVNGMWDGDIQTHRQHLECEEACRYLRDYILMDCIAFGELPEFLGEYNHEREFRSVLAKVKWRREKGRPLTWLPLKPISNQSLIDDRARGWV